MAKRKKGMTFIPYDYEAAYNKSLEDMNEFFVEQMFKHGKKVVYALKEIRAGDQFEVEIYPQFKKMDEVPPEGRSIKKDNDKAQRNLNDKNARKYVERLINENFTDRDLWLTFTYDNEHLPPDGDIDAAIKNVQKFIRRVNYQRKKRGLPNARYVYVTAYNPTEEIRWHHHIVMDGDMDMDVVEGCWKQSRMNMGTRYIGVTLMEDGVVYEIPDNVEVIINMTKPDKTHVHNDGEKSGNEALIPLTRGMLQVHGTALCEVQLYQNGALLTSATFEMEIFPSQRDESEIIHSGEYTRLENTIAAAREALQIAQDTQNTIDAAEAVRQAQERLREAAEKAREIKESRREDDTAKTIAKCVEAMEAAIEQTKKCLTATEEANKIIISQSGLDAILAAVKDYYERIRELETDININVDGGTPKSTDILLVKGGTPFTTDYDKYIAGTSHTI